MAQVRALADVADVSVANHAAVNTLSKLAELIIAQAPPFFAIAGHSMGGRIALEVARLAPARVRGLALLNSGNEPLAAGEAGAQERKRRLGLLELAQREGMRHMAQQWVQGMIHPARCGDTDLVETIVTMFERQTPEILALQTHALLTRPDARPVLAGVTSPVLVVCGRDDAWSPVDHQAEMASTSSDAHLAVIDDCAHMSTLERPGAVTDTLRAWLSRTSASESPPERAA